MVEESAQTVALGKQIATGGGMMLVMTLIHALGLTAISRTLNLKRSHLEEIDFCVRSVFRMSAMGLLLLILHTFEIGIFAALYLFLEALSSVEDAIYFSASAYTTLGITADYFPAEWRIVGAMEALIGFLLIGWSTAFIVSKVSRIMPD